MLRLTIGWATAVGSVAAVILLAGILEKESNVSDMSRNHWDCEEAGRG